jgi:hypothetical protein
MSLRGQTNEIVTRYVINGGALRFIRESEQFSIRTGAVADAIEFHTTSVMDLYAFAQVTHATARQPLALVSDQDWARFQQLVKEWHIQCGTISSPIDMAMCPAYQQILAMGAPAIRLILKQLELEGDDPDHWFWALNFLTGEDPVAPEDQGNLRKMSAAWRRWGRNNLSAW